VALSSGPSWVPSDPTCPAWAATWSSICAVWASKWNHRAWLSRQSAGLPEEQLAVSVLIQQVRAWVCVSWTSGVLDMLAVSV
jgi:phosphoenolpyruvate synthase/pyruvate phosphate dikinase